MQKKGGSAISAANPTRKYPFLLDFLTCGCGFGRLMHCQRVLPAALMLREGIASSMLDPSTRFLFFHPPSRSLVRSLRRARISSMPGVSFARGGCNAYTSLLLHAIKAKDSCCSMLCRGQSLGSRWHELTATLLEKNPIAFTLTFPWSGASFFFFSFAASAAYACKPVLPVSRCPHLTSELRVPYTRPTHFLAPFRGRNHGLPNVD